MVNIDFRSSGVALAICAAVATLFAVGCKDDSQAHCGRLTAIQCVASDAVKERCQISAGGVCRDRKSEVSLDQQAPENLDSGAPSAFAAIAEDTVDQSN